MDTQVLQTPIAQMSLRTELLMQKTITAVCCGIVAPTIPTYESIVVPITQHTLSKYLEQDTADHGKLAQACAGNL